MQEPQNDIALNTFDFREMRRNGAIYVDKTEWLYRLVRNPNSKFFFLSRPRRFGKSLMISTLKSIFQGDRALFEGLAISKTDYPFKSYPVLHFSFAGLDVSTIEVFEESFAKRVANALAEVGYAYDPTSGVGSNFYAAIRSLAKAADGQVVVLIDEYDAPVSHALDDPDKAEAIRDRMATFYCQLKENVGVIRFLMMTGVTKFTHLSVFSALNNLVDLTLDPSVALLLGYTDEELEQYFGAHLRAHAETMGLKYEDYRAALRRWYNGYRFSPDCEKTVYNPVAIARALIAKKRYFESTWSETGHASALMRYLERESLVRQDYERLPPVPKRIFDSYDLRNLRPETILYQAGYLTIKDFAPLIGYTLGVPDEDVRQDLNALLLLRATDADPQAEDARDTLCPALLSGDFPAFVERLRAFYAHLPYGPKEGTVHEAAYQRVLYALLSAGGLRVIAEDRQAQGRADLVAEGLGQVYVFELKVGGSADEALAQIRAKGYAEPYRAKGQACHLIGLAFDPATHALADAKAEPLL